LSEADVGSVILERFGTVAQLTLSRPSALNAMTWEMYQQLEDHLTSLAEDPTTRVLVIRGSGEKALAAGTDISQFDGFTGQDGLNYESKMDHIIGKLINFGKPTIALVHGYAIGGGMIIATACDLRYATAKARFGAPMSRTLGNCLSLANFQLLVQEIGPMRTKDLLYTARLMSAEEALSAGFLTAIFEEEDFFEKALKIAGQISNNAPLTVDATKEALNRLRQYNRSSIPSSAFDDVVNKVYGSKDFSEGVAAYLEKRPPVWQGE
jgi:enoyl-CoA hydratase/carnithine racemase